MDWTSAAVRTLVKLALQEDAARHDLTTRFLIPAKLRIEAQIRSKQSGVSCGLPIARLFFRALDPRIRFTMNVRGGQRIKAGQLMATIQGNAREILSAERPALNAVQH